MLYSIIFMLCNILFKDNPNITYEIKSLLNNIYLPISLLFTFQIFNNREFTIYRIYKGSSEFDSKEMSIFIDGIIQECKQLDIETMTPNEIAKLNLI